jgi:hypothetical protein
MENKSYIEKIKAVNEILEKGEKDGNYTSDHKGYTGYKPQVVIDAVNSQFCGEWDMEIVEKQTYPTKNKKGEGIKNAFVTVRLTLINSKIETMASHPILDDVGDAFKSAQTDALKKAFAHFSIGRRAYLGLLPNNK